MSNPSQAWLIVATREIYVRVTNRTFIISTLLTTVLIAGLAGFSVYQGNKASTSMVVVSNTAANLPVNKANEVAHAVDDKSTIKADHVKNDQAARAALADDNADAWLHESDHGWVLTAKKDVDLKVRTAVEGSVRSAALSANAAAAGTSIEFLMRGANVTVDRLDGKPDFSAVIKVATVAFSLVFFMAAMMFGIQIATSVVEEKQSRLVEIIATAIPLRHLLAARSSQWFPRDRANRLVRRYWSCCAVLHRILGCTARSHCGSGAGSARSSRSDSLPSLVCTPSAVRSHRVSRTCRARRRR